MSFKRFNRHEIFNADRVDNHMNLIRDIENYFYETTGSFGFDRDVRNMLYGIWDGFLYNDLLSLAEKELSSELSSRVKTTIEYINDNANFFVI